MRERFPPRRAQAGSSRGSPCSSSFPVSPFFSPDSRPRRAVIAYWGKVACFRATFLAFLAVYTLKLDSLRCILHLRDAHKSLLFTEMPPVMSVFARNCHDMRICGSVQSSQQKGQPPILAPQYCWKQWGSTRWNRMAVPFFRRIHSRNQSLARTITRVERQPRTCVWDSDHVARDGGATPMKRGLPSAPLSGRVRFSAAIGKDLTVQVLTLCIPC